MFDEVLGMAKLCTRNFHESVRDAFGASIETDVLEPILKEVDSLCIFNAAFKQQLISIDMILTEARLLEFANSGWT